MHSLNLRHLFQPHTKHMIGSDNSKSSQALYICQSFHRDFNIKVTFIFAFVTSSDTMTPVLNLVEKYRPKYLYAFLRYRQRERERVGVEVCVCQELLLQDLLRLEEEEEKSPEKKQEKKRRRKNNNSGIRRQS